MYLLGYDLGSSSVKASIIEAGTGKCLASAFHPKEEMRMIANQPGWAEQEPASWWENAKLATRDVIKMVPDTKGNIQAIGVSYQMHGLVLIDKNKKVLRPSIIWCDSRAVETGNQAFEAIGKEKCLASLLNSPGNFTASKLKWVKDNEPGIYDKIYKIMLPGDYLAMVLTDEICTTASGLSEGIFWDFRKNEVSDLIMKHYGFEHDFIPDVVPTFSSQGNLTSSAAEELGLTPGIPVAYRAGDQPNNAFSLNVLNPGEVAATAGTSGVVYGVSDETKYDPFSRVNTFAHVNHLMEGTRLGVLLCINGTGIMNSWTKQNMASTLSYEEMNRLAEVIEPGSENLQVFPFGNGAERMLNNKDTGCQVNGLNFNIHNRSHFIRAEQEGIVFSFKYGMEIMEQTGIVPQVIRAGNANMFLSPVFRESLASLTGATIELYNTDGSQGAARGAGIGAGIYKNTGEAFENLEILGEISPSADLQNKLDGAYQNWKKQLVKLIQ